MVQEHVDVVGGGLVANQHDLWQPAVGQETLRLLEAALPGDEAGQQLVARQAAATLGRCSPPASPGAAPRVGLVIGYVQSGKTLSFTTVTALARDNGFHLVVVLAGTKENLHDQTASRLADDLQVQRAGGLSPWFLVSNLRRDTQDAQQAADHLKRALDPSTPEMFRRTVVITVLKNRSRLDALREALAAFEEAGVHLDDVPALVVDDEADQAGLNTAVADDDESATYAAIVALRSALPRHTYLMYTATPQAPLLVNLADTLAPDFVAVLDAGKGYTGGDYFFGEHRSTFLKIIPASEVDKAFDGAHHVPPASLMRALATYLLGVVVRGGQRKTSSMLVHPSHTRELHDRFAGWVGGLRESWVDTLGTPGPDRDALLAEQFRPAYDDLLAAGAELPPFDELVESLHWWVGATAVRTVNSGTPADSDIQWDVAPSWILIGGNKLDRGFTVEGLTVTYMPRGTGVGNADTVQQRARFFGYKASYAPLCRAWLASSTADAFARYVEHERVLRRELTSVAAGGLSLKDWKRMMLLDPSFRPCRRAVIDLPYLHRRVRGNAWWQGRRLMVPQDWHEQNRGTMSRLLAGVAAPTPDPRDPRADGANHMTTVRLDDVVALMSDWRAHPEDAATLNETALLLRARLDDAPDLEADVYLMGDLRPRERGMEDHDSVINLFQGRGQDAKGFPGDHKFCTDDRVSLQLHVVQPKGGRLQVHEAPALALRIPTVLAGGILLQRDAG